jgi:hypothetical protein
MIFLEAFFSTKEENWERARDNISLTKYFD